MNTNLQDVLSRLKGLAPFPQVATRVMKVGRNPDLTAADIVEIIQTDAAISVSVLREANSAVFGAQEPITSIHDAGTRLGTKRLMRLVMKACARDCFSGLGDSTPRTTRSIWTESVTTACTARYLAIQAGSLEVDFAYTVGLVQNLGHIVLDRYLGEAREEIRTRLESGDPRYAGPDGLLNVERDVIGIDHAELGAQLGKKWSFSEELIEAMRFHHAPERSENQSSICALTRRAEEISMQILSGGALDAQALAAALTEDDEVANEIALAEFIEELSAEGIQVAAA